MVYVDNMCAGFGRMKMCHMVADTSAELHAMAERIGLPTKWVQCQGTYREHFDVCLSMKKRAIELGAVTITQQTYCAIVRWREKQVDRELPSGLDLNMTYAGLREFLEGLKDE